MKSCRFVCACHDQATPPDLHSRSPNSFTALTGSIYLSFPIKRRVVWPVISTRTSAKKRLLRARFSKWTRSLNAVGLLSRRVIRFSRVVVLGTGSLEKVGTSSGPGDYSCSMVTLIEPANHRTSAFSPIFHRVPLVRRRRLSSVTSLERTVFSNDAHLLPRTRT